MPILQIIITSSSFNKMNFDSWYLKYSLAERYWYRYKDIWSVELFRL